MTQTPRELDGLPRLTTGFDFLVGSWTVHNRRLREPLTGGDEWWESLATATSTTLHNGAISVDEMWFPDEGFAGTSFRVYTAADDTWAIYWVNSTTGHLQPPVSGRWDSAGGRFEAHGADEYAGRPIVARYLWHSIDHRTATWEQAFSVDDGQSWETNWVMTWTRDAGD
jgi:hypothetical protein